MEDVLTLVENYRSGWERIVRETGDVDEVNQYFHLPCFFIGADGDVLLFNVSDDISAFHRPRLESFQSGGVKKPRYKDFDILSLGENSALVSLTWEQYREDDSLERSWRHSYNTVKTENGWKILVSTFQAGA